MKVTAQIESVMTADFGAVVPLKKISVGTIPSLVVVVTQPPPSGWRNGEDHGTPKVGQLAMNTICGGK